MKIQLLISILFCQGYAAIEDSCGVPNEYDISLGRQCQGSIPHQFPWHVQLSACGNYCGGAIITDKHILTSASCVKDCNDFVVVIGMRASTRSIEAHIGHPHPGYDSSSHLNDIGIVELDSPIQFGSDAKPICLPKSNDYVGKMALSSGYAGIINVLYSPLTILEQNQCEGMKDFTVCTNEICYCETGTGAPLMLPGQAYELIGINSFATYGPCTGTPKKFTAVYPYLEWISSVIG